VTKNRIETVPAQEIEDIIIGSKNKNQSRDEQTVLSSWKNFISHNGINRLEIKESDKDCTEIRNGVKEMIIKSVSSPNIEGNKVIRRQDYLKEVNQLGSRCPANPDRPQTSKNNARPLNIDTDSMSIQGKMIENMYSPSWRTTQRNDEKKINLDKSPFTGTEKISRSIKTRPKSSRQFLVKKSKNQSSTKYRSDFFPKNKVKV